MKSIIYFFTTILILGIFQEGKGESVTTDTFEDDNFSFSRKERFTKTNLPDDLQNLLNGSKQEVHNNYTLEISAYSLNPIGFKYLKPNPDMRFVKVSLRSKRTQGHMRKRMEEEFHETRLLIGDDGVIRHFNSENSGGLFRDISSSGEAYELALFSLKREIADDAIISEFSGDCILISDLEIYAKLKENLVKKYGHDIRFSKGDARIGTVKVKDGYRVDLVLYRNLGIINKSYLITAENGMATRNVLRFGAVFAENPHINTLNAPANLYEGDSYKRIKEYDIFIKENLQTGGIRIRSGNMIFHKAGDGAASGGLPAKHSVDTENSDLQFTQDRDWKSPF